MSEALNGLRVIELGMGPVTGVAGMVLADFGAEVLRIENPQGDRLAALPAAPMWQRGKGSYPLDLKDPVAREELHSLCAGADVLLSNWRQSALVQKGLDADSLRERFPHLIHCHISGFGHQGALADLPGYEHVVAAYAGRMLAFAGIAEREGPVMSAVQVGVHAAIQSAVTGILAAVLQRGEKGQGRRVETSLLQGMLPYEMGSMIGLQFRDVYEAMMPAIEFGPTPPLPSLFYHPAQAGDGRWMQFGNLLPHLFDNFLIATDLIDVVADPAFDHAQMLLQPEENHEAFRARMLGRIQERAAAEWMQDFVADGGIVATTYQTTQQALTDPDLVANGHVIEREDGALQLGPLARLTKTPAMPGASRRPGANLVADWLSAPREKPVEPVTTRLPLEDIRVVEIATIIAAPLGSAFLADLGASVTKVEQIGGDPFRSLLGGLGAARVNAGKRSISVNLKSEEGRQIVMKLLAEADVVIHNYRPGVPERLGIGYEQVRERNPGVVYLQCNGYGPDGPGAHRPSTHPVPGAAVGGVMYQMGEKLPADLLDADGLRLWCSRLMRANELNPDPNTALVIATSALLGLSARQRTGQGQRILVDMFGANAYANADDFIAYPGKSPRPQPDDLLLGLAPGYRLYACNNSSWVFLALTCEAEQELFIQVLTEAGIEAPSLSVLAAEDDETVTKLTSLFATREADEWESLFVPGGVACVRADRFRPASFWLEDEQVRANGFVGEASHPILGRYLRPGPLLRFDRLTHSLPGPPLAGEHNQSVLADLGYAPAAISALVEKGVLFFQSST